MLFYNISYDILSSTCCSRFKCVSAKHLSVLFVKDIYFSEISFSYNDKWFLISSKSLLPYNLLVERTIAETTLPIFWRFYFNGSLPN